MTVPVSKPKAYLCLVLHAHLPFVYHPDRPYVREENWLFEAITGAYLPLLSIFDELADNRVLFRIAMSVTPTLCAMLRNDLLQQRYIAYIDSMIQLAGKEIVRCEKKPCFRKNAQLYYDKFTRCRLLFADRYQGDLVGAFAALQRRGVLEIMGSAATHGYFPAMQCSEHAVRAQIRVGMASHERFFGAKPNGIWLPECGYYPGIERILEQEGLRYFFTDAHGVLFADPRPRYGVFSPILCGDSRVAVFARDMASSESVWSSKAGYPGDYVYRDFYRDAGFDLPAAYIKPHIDPSGERTYTGVKYYKITGPTDRKEPYDYDTAINKAYEHAAHFLHERRKQAAHLAPIMDRTPIIVAPYDAELFGHWWYEGPYWLNFLIRKMAMEQDVVAFATPSDYLTEYPTHQICRPIMSSWGEKGYSEVWLDSSNDWIYRHLHAAEDMMRECARAFPGAQGTLRRALNQMARELLLAESSDWAFIMKTGTIVEYAVKRTRGHCANFMRLYTQVNAGDIDERDLQNLEFLHPVFPDIDYRVYA